LLFMVWLFISNVGLIIFFFRVRVCRVVVFLMYVLVLLFGVSGVVEM